MAPIEQSSDHWGAEEQRRLILRAQAAEAEVERLREANRDAHAETMRAHQREDVARAEVERLREALRGVLTGRVILDETDDGQAILLDLSTDPATPVCF